MKYFVVSDTHSYYTPFIEALSAAGYFDCAEEKRLVILGDLFDRGDEPLELLNFVLDRLDSPELILIKGNHEDLYEKLMFTDRGRKTRQHHLNGTWETACRFTDMECGYAEEHPSELAAAMAQTDLYTRIIPAMRNYYETEKYIFVHGWMPCTDKAYLDLAETWRGADDTAWAEARWVNGMIAARNRAVEPGKTTVCGHFNASFGHCLYEHSCEEQFGALADHSPYYAPGIIAIDANTNDCGFVNCIVLED